jgi:hypothetical protein
MTAITKVFIAGATGSFVASWAEPKIVAKLPDSLKTPTGAKVTHAVIAGGSAAVCYYALGKLGVTS